jgi:hypothetical protein
MDPASDLLNSVIEDINSLNTLGSDSTEPEALKSVSQLVFRLLVAGDLQKAQTSMRMPKSPQIKGFSLHSAYVSDPGRNYAFALAGGAIINGSRVIGISRVKDEINLTPPNVPKIATIPLVKYLDSPGVMINGVPVNRRALIKYVTTKLDDPDFDFIADESHDGRLQLLLDSEGARHCLNDVPLAYYELLSIGQALITSPNVIRLSRRIEKFLNQDDQNTADTTGE